MASSVENVSMALFCDFENVALGVRDIGHDKFDIKPVLERLLLKGSIVVKKAYCDWERYKGFKATMHEANFELIEIPHVRQSGKNSADIRLVVDALDLCYTKSHVNTFVIISGDSDFSPLVSKLRENAKQVIGVGVKQSTSDLLIANCDEFIFYDDLVRESQRMSARRQPREMQQPAVRRSPDEERQRKDELEMRRSQAIDMAVETFDALSSERGDSGKIWASVLKEAIKRRKPDFNETWYGFRAFGNLLEEAQARGLLEFGRDDKSGAYVFRSGGSGGGGGGSGGAGFAPAGAQATQGSAQDGFHQGGQPDHTGQHDGAGAPDAAQDSGERREPRRRGRGGRGSGRGASDTGYPVDEQVADDAQVPRMQDRQEPVSQPLEPEAETPSIYMSRARSTRAQADAASVVPSMQQNAAPAPVLIEAAPGEPADTAPEPSAQVQAPAKAPARTRRPRKPAAKTPDV
jgi:uncharacterized LabA/DUF88 family protein